MRRVITLVALLALLSGCHVYQFNKPLVGDETLVKKQVPMYGGKDFFSSVNGWFVSRGCDFMDMFGLAFSNGDGYQLNARCTKILQLGAGDLTQTEKMGFYGREVGLWQETRQELGFGPLYWNRFKKTALNGNEFFFEWFPSDQEVTDLDLSIHNDRSFWQVGFNLHLLAGGEAYVDVYEVFDFAAGFIPTFLFGYPIDAAHDDVWTSQHDQKPTAQN